MVTRTEIIERGRDWVRRRIPYSMENFTDGWRRDCSGFVSMCWRLDRNYWTGNLHLAGEPLRGNADLQPGDMLLFHNTRNPHSGSHVVLFVRWNRPGDPVILEQTGAGGGRPREIAWSATGRRNLSSYKPFRPRRLDTDAAPAVEGEDDDMKLILGNVEGKATIWSGLRGVSPAYAHQDDESVQALEAAGAVRRTFKTPRAMLGALGAEEAGDAAATLKRMGEAG